MRSGDIRFVAVAVLLALISCRPYPPVGWTAYTISNSLVVWLPPTYQMLPSGDGEPRFADRHHSAYLERVPARTLSEPWLVSRSTREGSLIVGKRTTDTISVRGRQLVVERAVGGGLPRMPEQQRLIAVHIPLNALSGAVLYSAYEGDGDRTLIAIAGTVELTADP